MLAKVGALAHCGPRGAAKEQPAHAIELKKPGMVVAVSISACDTQSDSFHVQSPSRVVSTLGARCRLHGVRV